MKLQDLYRFPSGKFGLLDADFYHYKWCRIKEEWGMFLMWKLTGWPFKHRCCQCAGSGWYQSESSARYGDEPDKCPLCNGTGLCRRSAPWRRY